VCVVAVFVMTLVNKAVEVVVSRLVARDAGQEKEVEVNGAN
jgi:hypothetical protein